MREQLVEGVNDTKNRHPAQRSRTTQQSGTRHRDIHDPSAEMNVPNLQYFDISNASQHLGGLTDADAQVFIKQPPPPPRTVTDVMNNFARSSEQLHITEMRNFAVGIIFGTTFSKTLLRSTPPYLLIMPRLDPEMMTPPSRIATVNNCLSYVLMHDLYYT
jgi:hypothetical protein